MSHKELLRKVLIGAAVYGVGELMYQVGKGDMLGIISYYNFTATDAITALSDDKKKSYPTNVILGVCRTRQEYLSKKHKSR